MLKWPEVATGSIVPGAERAGTVGRGATRTVGAQVILVNGSLAAYLSRGARQLLVYLPEDEPQRSATGRPLAAQLAAMARLGGLMIAEINGYPTADHPLAPYLVEAGFHPSAMGFMMRRGPLMAPERRATGPASPTPRPQAEAKAGA